MGGRAVVRAGQERTLVHQANAPVQPRRMRWARAYIRSNDVAALHTGRAIGCRSGRDVGDNPVRKLAEKRLLMRSEVGGGACEVVDVGIAVVSCYDESCGDTSFHVTLNDIFHIAGTSFHITLHGIM